MGTGYTCRVRNLRTESLAGFRLEKDALSAGGKYLRPDDDGWLDASGRKGLCIVCENCGSVIEEASGEAELSCPDCGESTFRVLRTFRLVTIKDGFLIRWYEPNETVEIQVPDRAGKGLVGIHYTVDGSDPTQESPVYTGPIPYSGDFKPIRAAVFYVDARSQIIEWDYGRAEKNRKRIQQQSRGRSNRSPAGGRSDRKVPPPRPPSRHRPSRPEVKRKSEVSGLLKFLAAVLGLILGLIAVSLFCGKNKGIKGGIVLLFLAGKLLSYAFREDK